MFETVVEFVFIHRFLWAVLVINTSDSALHLFCFSCHFLVCLVFYQPTATIADVKSCHLQVLVLYLVPAPFAAGAPSNQAHPLVLDMSTAQNDDLHEMNVDKATSQLGEHLKVCTRQYIQIRKCTLPGCLERESRVLFQPGIHGLSQVTPKGV